MSVSRHSKNLTSFASLYCQSQLFLSLSVGFGCLLKDSLVLGAVFEICDLLQIVLPLLLYCFNMGIQKKVIVFYGYVKTWNNN